MSGGGDKSNLAMIAGTIYGVALNDREQHRKLAAAFLEPPYKSPPRKPVLYIKPRTCLMGEAGVIPMPPDLEEVEIAATLGLLIGRDSYRAVKREALAHISGICLALDISEPYDGFYRPPVRQNCRDGFLRLGALAPFAPGVLQEPIETFVDGRPAHSWAADRLVRDAATLIADISQFMTLAAGDLLLIGLAHDAPRLAAGSTVAARCGSLPRLSARVAAEAVP